jgi:protein TonB
MTSNVFGRSILWIAALGILLSGRGFGQSQDQSRPPSAPESSAPQDAPRHISPEITSGLLIKRVNPTYPGKARARRIQGVLIMRATISEQGNITDLQVVSGDPMLAKAAMKAVKQWKYRPYLFNGEPVAVVTPIQVNFTLSGG